MTCHICDVIERDLNDVARQLERRKAAQMAAIRANDPDEVALEIRALASAKAQIETRYSQHRKSVSH